ncbi:hypothetical protein CLOP_g2163 [Closterium sp. NIES-67]|nr:hypothetical protein CLOP_g2163 [Closterium sp. NIES-67]
MAATGRSLQHLLRRRSSYPPRQEDRLRVPEPEGVRQRRQEDQDQHPPGPSGDYKFKVDPSGSPSKGKGAYSFAKKYGANVDGYSPIWTPSEWSAKGDTYEGGKAGLLLWFLTFGGLLAIGALLIVNTSAIA